MTDARFALFSFWITTMALGVVGCSGFNHPVRLGLATSAGTTLRFYIVSEAGGLTESTGSPFTAASATAGVFVSPGTEWLASYDTTMNLKLFPISGKNVTLGTGVSSVVAGVVTGFAACMSVDGRSFFYADLGNTLTAEYPVNTNGTLGTPIDLAIDAQGCATDPTGRGFWVSNSTSSSLSLYGTISGGSVSSLANNAAIAVGNYIAPSLNGETLVTSNAANSSIRVVSVSGTSTSITGTTALAGITGIVRVGSFYAVSSGSTLRLYSVVNGVASLVTTLANGAAISSISGDTYGKFLAVGDASGMKLYSVSTAGVLAQTASTTTGATTRVALDYLLAR